MPKKREIKWESVNDWDSIKKFPVIFKRFSLESKYKSGVINSLRAIEWRLNSDKDALVYPWEVSIYAMLSLMGENETARRITNREAIKIFNFIRNNMFSFFDADLRCVMQVLMSVEKKEQFNYRILCERFIYFFGHVGKKLDLPKMIKERFNTSGKSLIDICVLSIILGVNRMPFEQFGWVVQEKGGGYFSAEFIDTLKLLSIGIDEFRRLQEKYFEKSTYDYFLARNVLEEKPFVVNHDGKYLLPAPHLVVQAATHGILSQLTKGNDQICADIGKEIQEAYLLRIFQFAGCYKIVKGEVCYSKDGRAADSPDVMLEHDNVCVLIDSKFARPSLRLRDLTLKTAQELAMRLSDYICQIHQRIKERESYLEHAYPDESVFGLVVVFEDSLVIRDFVYEQVAKRYPSDIDYIKRHIHIVGLDEIEKYCYRHTNLIPGLIRWSCEEKSHNDFCIPFSGRLGELDLPQYSRIEEDVRGFANRILYRGH